MNKKLNVKEILIPTLSLLIICLFSTTLLAFTNQQTQPLIEERSAQSEDATKSLVLADAKSFTDAKIIELGTEEYTYFEGLDEKGDIVGYIFIASAKGYGGEIRVMTGIDKQGAVSGVQTLIINETAGLGMNASEDSFLNQYIGKDGDIAVSKASPYGNEIQALTGATITSQAITDTVNTALSLFAVVTGGANNG